MARVLTDNVPTPVEAKTEADLPNLSESLKSQTTKLNEILRLQSIGINTIEFGDGITAENILCDFVAVQYGTAGAELSSTHGLNKTPIAIVGKKLNMPGDVYFSKAATTTTIYTKSDTDNLSGTIIVA